MADGGESGADLVLVAQLCSKLCHDLAGTIGAIANGAELLADEDDADIREQALGLLAQSAEQAARRLKFYRIAFGAGAASGTASIWASSRMRSKASSAAAGSSSTGLP